MLEDASHASAGVGRLAHHAKTLRIKHTEYRPPPSRIPGHNFAIGLLQTLEARMDDLREDFNNQGGSRQQHGVTKDVFVKLLTKRIEQGPRSVLERPWLATLDRETLKANIGAVFESVAATGKRTITFEELLTYVIDCSMCGQVGHVEERVPQHETSGCSVLRNLDEITRAVYCPELGKIITAGKTVGIVDGATMQTRSIAYATDPKDRFPCVYDVDYIPHLNAVLCVGTDMSAHIISADRGRRLFTIPTNETHQVCAFDRSSSLALLASRDGDLMTFRILPHRTTEAKFERGTVMRRGARTVLRLLPLGHDGLVAAGSADSSVTIHDVSTGNVLTRFVGHFDAGGVRALCHIAHLNMMSSCAYNTEPLVWMVSSAATRSDAFTLADAETPHIGHVVDICGVPDSPQLNTLDVHGLVKIWDIRTFRCVQSIKAEKMITGVVDTAMMKWNSVVWDESCRELCVVSRRRLQKLARCIPVKEMEAVSSTTNTIAVTAGGPPGRREPTTEAKSDDLAVTDEYPLLCVALNPATQTVVTCSEQKVRIWDAFTGRQEILFDRLVTAGVTPISTLCVNDSGKCFFLGHRGGRLASHAFSTGALIHKFVDDGAVGASEVLSITYLRGTNALAAVTWNGCRVYYDQTNYHDGTQSFYPDGSRSIEVKTVDWDPVFSILTAGDRTGCVSLWESRMQRFTADSVRSIGKIEVADAEVSAVHFLTGFSAIAAADINGRLALFTTMPHPHPNRRIAELYLAKREIVHMAFYPPRRLLYCGDDKGGLFVVDVAAALATVGITAAASSWEGMMVSVGRQGKVPQEVVTMAPARSVQAHSDAITGLMWIPGTPIIMTCSIDRHAAAWTLGLELRGPLDPLALSGRFSVPFARPTGLEFIHAPPDDEDLWETEHTPVSADSVVASGSPARADAGAVAASVTSAAKFDEEIRRTAIQLQSIFKDRVTSASQQKAALIAQMDGSAPTAHSLQWRPEPVIKEARETGLVSVTEHGGVVSRGPSPTSSDQQVARDVYSVNSTGVDCHSLLTPEPNAREFRRKRHVVDRGAPQHGASDGADTGLRFEVTRDCPLPPNARAERDFLLRQMKDKEELVAQQAMAAAVASDPFRRPRGGSAVLTDISACGFTTNALQSMASPVRSTPPPQHHRGSHRRRREASQQALEQSPAERALTRLLPHELISMRKLPRLKPATAFEQICRTRARSTTPHEHSTLVSLPFVDTPAELDDVDWSAAPAMRAERDSHLTQRLPSRSLSTPMRRVPRARPWALTGNGSPVRSTLVARDGDDASPVGFTTLGVRSLAGHLLTPAGSSDLGGTRSFNGTFTTAEGEATGRPWAKRHCVDLDSFDTCGSLHLDN